MSSASATPNTYPYQNEPNWSKSEKAIARTVFDAALRWELQDVMQQAKQMANQIKEPADVTVFPGRREFTPVTPLL